MLLKGGETELVMSVRQEVSPVATYLNERPWALPAACAPMSDVRDIPAVDLLSATQAHQAQAQAELILAQAPVAFGGTTGSTGADVQFSSKRMDVSGVPPRGKPV